MSPCILSLHILMTWIFFPVGEVAFVELFVDENDKPRGCGIVEFHSPELAQKAVEKMHRYELKGRKLVVKEVCSFFFFFQNEIVNVIT